MSEGFDTAAIRSASVEAARSGAAQRTPSRPETPPSLLDRACSGLRAPLPSIAADADGPLLPPPPMARAGFAPASERRDDSPSVVRGRRDDSPTMVRAAAARSGGCGEVCVTSSLGSAPMYTSSLGGAAAATWSVSPPSDRASPTTEVVRIASPAAPQLEFNELDQLADAASAAQVEKAATDIYEKVADADRFGMRVLGRGIDDILKTQLTHEAEQARLFAACETLVSSCNKTPPSHVAMLARLKAPPPELLAAVEPLLLALRLPLSPLAEESTVLVGGEGGEAWRLAAPHLSAEGGVPLMEKLKSFNVESLDPELIELMEPYFGRFSYSQIRKKIGAAANLFQWASALGVLGASELAKLPNEHGPPSEDDGSGRSQLSSLTPSLQASPAMGRAIYTANALHASAERGRAGSGRWSGRSSPLPPGVMVEEDEGCLPASAPSALSPSAALSPASTASNAAAAIDMPPPPGMLELPPPPSRGSSSPSPRRAFLGCEASPAAVSPTPCSREWSLEARSEGGMPPRNSSYGKLSSLGGGSSMVRSDTVNSIDSLERAERLSTASPLPASRRGSLHSAEDLLKTNRPIDSPPLIFNRRLLASTSPSSSRDASPSRRGSSARITGLTVEGDLSMRDQLLRDRAREGGAREGRSPADTRSPVPAPPSPGGSANNSPTAARPVRAPPPSFDDLHPIKFLGAGNFANVFMCKDSRTGRYYALKSLLKALVIQNQKQHQVMAERAALDASQHHCIIRLVATYCDTQHLYLLLEVALGGELFQLMNSIGTFTESQTRFYAGSLTLALGHLHKLGYMYRDVKPENLLLTREGYLKLCDLGLAKRAVRGWTLVGTPEYTAPEVIRGEGATAAVDWWQLGVLIFEMVTGDLPFQGSDGGDDRELFTAIIRGAYTWPPPPADCEERSQSVVAFCASLLRLRGCETCTSLHASMPLRLGASATGTADVMANEWWEGLDWTGLATGTLPPPFIPELKSDDDDSNFGPLESRGDPIIDSPDYDGKVWDAFFVGW